MSGSQIGGALGFIVGSLFGVPQLGFILGSTLGGIVDPVKIKGPRLSDAQAQTSQEGVPIPFGYGTFPTAGNVIWAGVLVEHEHEEGSKGGPKQITYTYTRSYAIGVCEGEISGIQRIKRNGKLVYDISPSSTIPGKSTKFLKRCTIYTGSETQTVDPTIEAAVGVNNSGPMRGLAYIVMEDDDLTDTQGAIPQYEFVVQKCGTVTSVNDDREYFVAALEGVNSVETGTRTGVWTAHGAEISDNKNLRLIAAHNNACVALDSNVPVRTWRSTDYGVNWQLATSGLPTTNRIWRGLCRGPGHTFYAVAAGNGADVNKSYFAVSTDDGDTWSQSLMTGVQGVFCVHYAQGVIVAACSSNGLNTNGIWTSPNGSTWTQRSTSSLTTCLYFNGSAWLAVGGNGKTLSAGPTAATWTDHGSPGAGSWSFTCLTGGPGFFIAGTTDHTGIKKTTDNGATWVSVFVGGTDQQAAAYGMGTVVVGDNDHVRFSYDEGATWVTHDLASANHYTNDIAFMGPRLNWYTVPDGDGLYADEDGNLITDYAEVEEVSSCQVQLDEIVADLCERAGIDATEYDVSELDDILDGYKCATEASAQAFIDPLTRGFFFDRGEWDKKVRFPKRGGASVAALTTADLVARDPLPIDQTRVQEFELLRKVNVSYVDPAAGYNMGKQTEERRVGTIQARGEATEEIPIVCDATTAKRIADKRLKVAWAETDKFAFSLAQPLSKLTPTDVVTLTDGAGASHRIRLVSLHEEDGIFGVDEAMKDRASTYSSVATGVENPNEPDPNDTVTGPTLFVPMNLPQLRTQDNTPGVYVGACGILAGWNGCTILLSTDGGVSYQTALTITTPTVVGNLTSDMDASYSPDTVSVHVFGTLESKTTAQVAAGGNYSAIVPDQMPDFTATSTDNEIIAYEDATETAPGYYTLGTLSRNLLDTTAEDHFTGDYFVDLRGVYFIPVDANYAGTTLYFKAVSFGTSADSVDPVTLLYEAVEYVLDGGGA